MAAIAYRCSTCSFEYYDHGPDNPMGQHRRIMAAFRVKTWEEAEQLVAAGALTTSSDPSWEGQECGDRSAHPRGQSCGGHLVRVYEN